MRSRLWWFTSAALIWTAAAFVSLIAMAVTSFEFLFTSKDDAAILLAGGTRTCMVAGGVSLVAWVVAGMTKGHARFRGPSADIAAQGAFAGFGGLLACLYAASALAAIVAAPLALYAASRLGCYEDERRWVWPGLVGLSAASMAFIILIVEL